MTMSLRPQIHQDAFPRGGRDGYHTRSGQTAEHRAALVAVAAPQASPLSAVEPRPFDLDAWRDQLSRAIELIDEQRRQLVVLRVERDEARHAHHALAAVIPSVFTARPCKKCRAPFIGRGKESVCHDCRLARVRADSIAAYGRKTGTG